AELEYRRSGAQTDDDTFVALDHESGVRSQLWMSAVAAQAGPRFRVLGSRAAYTKYGLDVQEEQLVRGRRPDEAGWGPEAEGFWGTAGGRRRAQGVPPGGGGVQAVLGGSRAGGGGGRAPAGRPRRRRGRARSTRGRAGIRASSACRRTRLTTPKASAAARSSDGE